MIETAKLNGLCPYYYFRYILTKCQGVVMNKEN